MIIAITGHRPNKLGFDYHLTSPLIGEIKRRIITILDTEKPDHLITGMAQGIDTLFARIAIELNIPFTAAIPCYEQDKNWDAAGKSLYRQLITHKLCTQRLITPAFYTEGVMQKRNKWMVEACDKIIAVWNGSQGGTCNTVIYANWKSKEVIRINPEELTIQLNN